MQACFPDSQLISTMCVTMHPVTVHVQLELLPHTTPLYLVDGVAAIKELTAILAVGQQCCLPVQAEATRSQ